jgi:hypothetical protein
MRVGMIAPISWRVPPRHYGPWERVVSILTEGLVTRGIDVTLFATADSVTSARLVAVAPAGYSEDPSIDAKAYEGLHIAAAFERAGEFDLLHNHFDFLPLTYSRLVNTPVVTTIHGFSSDRILPVFRAYNDIGHYVSISEADRHPSLNYVATVYHGIPPGEFTFRSDPGDYLLFFGRIHPEKGAREAIEVARRSGRKLVLAGIIQDEQYFREAVAPSVDGDQVRYVGSVGPAERTRCWAAPSPFCTSSASKSRSGFRWWKPWPPARRSSRSGGARCRRSSSTGPRASWSKASRRQRRLCGMCRASTGPSAVRMWKAASQPSAWWTTTFASIEKSSTDRGHRERDYLNGAQYPSWPIDTSPGAG